MLFYAIIDVTSRHRHDKGDGLLDQLEKRYRVVLPTIPLRAAFLSVTECRLNVQRTYDQKYPDSVGPFVEQLSRALNRAMLGNRWVRG